MFLGFVFLLNRGAPRLYKDLFQSSKFNSLKVSMASPFECLRRLRGYAVYKFLSLNGYAV